MSACSVGDDTLIDLRHFINTVCVAARTPLLGLANVNNPSLMMPRRRVLNRLLLPAAIVAIAVASSSAKNMAVGTPSYDGCAMLFAPVELNPFTTRAEGNAA